MAKRKQISDSMGPKGNKKGKKVSLTAMYTIFNLIEILTTCTSLLVFKTLNLVGVVYMSPVSEEKNQLARTKLFAC